MKSCTKWHIQSTDSKGLSCREEKFKNPVYFENYAKLIFSANELPYTDDTSDVFFRRWIILDFPYQFVDVPDIENENERQKDPTIDEQLHTQQELSGVLNWALGGLDHLLKQNRFSENTHSREIE